MCRAFIEADKIYRERLNAQAHLLGLYFYEALCDVSPILHAFPGKGAKPIPYRSEPYPIFVDDDDREDESEEDADRLQAELYMRQMVRAGKNWGNGGA